MGNPLGFHFIPTHRHQFYLDAFTNVQPNVSLILDAGRGDYEEVRRRAPNSKIIMRSYEWSDGGMDVLNRAQSDPIGTGNWMADKWIGRFREWGNLIDPGITYFTGVNEYTVIPGVSIPPLVLCEGAFARRLATAGLKACIGNEGVGHPSMTNSAGKVDWSLYASWEKIIQETGSILGLHEYWLAQDGPRMNVKPEDEARGLFWYAWRFMQCPFDVPVAITEWGVDQKVNAPGGTPSHGWQGLLSPNQYAAQLQEYILKALKDKRFVGATIFTHDYASDEWATYDTSRGLNEIVAMARTLPQVAWYVPGTYVPTPIPPTPIPPNPNPPVTGKVVHPLPGFQEITGRFYQPTGNPEIPYHNGTDMSAQAGLPIKCVADGVVLWVDKDPGYGLYVRVWHAQYGIHSHYSHMSAQAVQRGQAVKAGDVLGYVGSTGNSTGPHLHFECRMGDANSYNPISPMPTGRCDPETWMAFHGVSLSTGATGGSSEVFLPLVMA